MIAEFLVLLSKSSFLILIIGGFFSSLFFLERLGMVFSEELKEWAKFISYFGAVWGILVLAMTASNLIVPYLSSPELGRQTGWDVNIIGAVLGITLCLRPIKDFKWSAIISLTVGLGVMVLIWFFTPSNVDLFLYGVVFGFMGIFYLSLKFVEDIYSLLGNILTAPPVAVGIGAIAILEGILLFFGSSFLAIVGI